VRYLIYLNTTIDSILEDMKNKHSRVYHVIDDKEKDICKIRIDKQVS